jgi:pimeloyl-ACP methyl ester carboxylesterase
MKKIGVVALAVVLLIVILFIYRQPLILRVTGMRPFVEERFGGWVDAGADEEELDATLKRIHDPLGSGPGSWVYELGLIASKHELAASEAELTGDTAEAARENSIAAVYYFIARFPFVSSPAKAEAYRKHIECYLRAAETFDPPLEIVRIPFEGKEIIGYLRIPDVEGPPVVVVTGGVDTWKSDVEMQVEAMLAEDLAVFAFDMPGTGESQWPLEPNSDRVYSAAIEYLKNRSDLDGDNVGVFLQSFAGLFAVKLALVDPNIKAAVNIGGPIHLAYTPEHVKKVPDVMIATISHAMGADPDSGFKEMVARAEPMSLGKQGLLKEPARQAALLSINGDQDHLVPIDDLYIISKSGIKQEEWVYEGDGHCAPNNMPEFAPEAAAWLKGRLTAAQVEASVQELEFHEPALVEEPSNSP